MITQSLLSISSNATVSLTRVKEKQDHVDAQNVEIDIDDSVNLSIGLDVAEKLRQAKSPEELISLLKKGQEEARNSFEKFKAIQQERIGRAGHGFEGDQLFEAVRKTVVTLLSAKTDSSVNFQETLVSYLNQQK